MANEGQDIRARLDEEYQKQMKALQGEQRPAKGDIANMRQQSLAGFSVDNFCTTAPAALKSIEDEIKSFAWFIPDKIEIPALAVLRTLEVVLPEMCKIGGIFGTTPAPKPKTNFNT